MFLREEESWCHGNRVWMLKTVLRLWRSATGLRSRGFEGEVQDSIVRLQFERQNAGVRSCVGDRLVDLPVESWRLIGVEVEVRCIDRVFGDEWGRISRIEAGTESLCTYNPLSPPPDFLKARMVV
jgi:hypothetical protein